MHRTLQAQVLLAIHHREWKGQRRDWESIPSTKPKYSKGTLRGWHCGAEGCVITCSAGIPWFESQLTQLLSGSWLMDMGRQEGRVTDLAYLLETHAESGQGVDGSDKNPTQKQVD